MNERKRNLIPEDWDVPRRFRDRIGADGGRQRAMCEDGAILIILHDVPRPGDAARRARLFYRAKDRTWKAAGSMGSGLSALKKHVESVHAAIDALETQLEKAHRAANYFSVLQSAAPLLRTARNMHKTLQEAREASGDDPDLITLRDRAGDLERAIELVHGDAKSGLEFTIAKRVEQQAEIGQTIATSSHRLNLIAAMFLPLTALTSVFGMNLHSALPERISPLVFWAVVALGVAVGFLVRSSLETKQKPRDWQHEAA